MYYHQQTATGFKMLLAQKVSLHSAGRAAVLIAAWWMLVGAVSAAAPVPWDEPVDADYKHASPEAYERFRDWKFGIRIHWGVYSISPVRSDASWSLYDHDLEYHHKYHQLYKQFNPVEFDADEWMKLFERAGIKYFTFTTKHHDGFSMWDTKTRVKRRYVFSGPNAGKMEDCDLAYGIMDTPFKRDIVKELVEASRRHNMGAFLYFSHWDWYDADFRWSGIGRVPYERVTRENDPEGYARFILRHREQISELLSNFGKIDGLEFDCEPRGTYSPYNKRGIEDWSRYWPDIKETVKQARRLGPDVLFRERGIGSYGDFHTPECVVPANPDSRSESANVKVWQVIYPAGGAASWIPNGSYLSAEWILANLIDITAKGGNFQVGYGPMPNGRFDPKAIERLKYVGDWLKVNGEAIYATRPREGDLWKEGADIRFTRSKDNKTVYAICLKWPGSRLIIKSARAAEGSEIRMLGVSRPLTWRQDADGLVIDIPPDIENVKPCRQAYAFKIAIADTM